LLKSLCFSIGLELTGRFLNRAIARLAQSPFFFNFIWRKAKIRFTGHCSQVLTMASFRKVKVSYGQGKSKVIQLPSSTQSYSDLQVLKRNLLDQLVKDKSIEDLGGDTNTEIGDLSIYYHDADFESDVEHESDVVLRDKDKNLIVKLNKKPSSSRKCLKFDFIFHVTI
jgi:hypothetical protein